MPVSPIEESESLSQSGETEKADEGMDDRSMPIRDSRATILEQYGDKGEELRKRGKALREGKSPLGHGPEAMEEEEEEESSEGRKAVGRKSPKEPTKAEREEHERTHCPYRSWCEHCVRARARNSHHRRQVPEERLEEVKVPRIHLDYFFMSREDEEACKNPLLVMADERSGSRYARAVGVKGLGEANSMDWLIEDMSAILKSWGHAGGTGGEIIIKSDGEPALLAVRSAVMKYHGGVIIPESPAKGEKAENGLIEEAGKTVREFVCTFISQIEHHR